MYYFFVPLNKELDEILKKNYRKHSSDLSCNPEGYILDENQINSIIIIKSRQHKYYNLYHIPEEYQNDIDEFITDYWDGNIIIEKENEKVYKKLIV